LYFHIVIEDESEPPRLKKSLIGTTINERLGDPFSFDVHPLATFKEDEKVVADAFQYAFRVGTPLFNKHLQDKTGVSILHVLEQLEGVPISP